MAHLEVEPEFKGKVLDAETGEPIEGAVVVVVYTKFLPGFTGAGGDTFPMKVKETLTDKKGEFYFPSYTTLIQPLSTEDKAEFIIYKPGYGSFPECDFPKGITLVGEQIFFSKEIGSTGDLELLLKEGGYPQLIKLKVIFGIVELPRLKSREKEVLKPPTDIRSKELPLLYKAINEEGRN